MKSNYKERTLYVIGNRMFELLARISFIITGYITLHTYFRDPRILMLYLALGTFLTLWMIYHYSTTSYRIYSDSKRLKKNYHREFLNKKVYIGYEVGSFWDVVDRFKEEEEVAAVLGVNNRFCLDEQYLSRTSLVSDYMKNFTEEEKRDLAKDIELTMAVHRIEANENNERIYEFGSLYILPPTDGIHYEDALLSMCEPSPSNLAGRFTSTRETLIESFEKLFEQMPSVFTNSTLIIPLIGTKSSGSPLSQEEVAKFLISAFANYSRVNQHRLARRLVISLYDKDFENKKELMKIKNHIDMEVNRGDFSYSTLKSEIR